MTNTSESIESLRIGGGSLMDYSTEKQRSFGRTQIPIDVVSFDSDDSRKVSLQANSKQKKLNKTKIPVRHAHSSTRTRSQSSAPKLNHQDPEWFDTRHHHHRHHHHRSDFGSYDGQLEQQPRQSQQQQQQQQHVDIVDGCDIRLFIIRHGERVDRFFGPNWFAFAFDQFGQYRPYHVNFPPSLPSRSNPQVWALDTPLTRDGLVAAQNVGRVLRMNRFEPTYVYSSPAMRCILTTYQILKGLGLEKTVAIRIEPGLLELGASRFGMQIFLNALDWHHYGINVDLSYRPIMTVVPPIEREDEYYLRSKYVVREIEQRHNDSNPVSSNILIVGHATSPETLTWDLVGRQPNVYDLYALSMNIGYLQMVITERNRSNKLWSLTQMPLQSTTLKWV